MSDRSSFGFLMDQLAGLALGFILLCVLMIPMAVMTSGWGGAAVLISIVVIFVLCMLSADNSENPKDSTKVKYQPYKPNSKYKYKQRKQPKNFSNESTIQWKYCDKCGHRLNRVTKKCPYCGYEF